MTDTKQALSEFYKLFKTNNSSLNLNRGLSTKNNIDSINRLLDSLVTDKEEKDKVDALLKRNQATSTFTTEHNNSPALPSYNTRSPYIEIRINEMLIIPSTDPNTFLDAPWLESVNANIVQDATGNIQSISGISGVGSSFTNTQFLKDTVANTGTDSDALSAMKNLDVNFDNLNLDMPMGGVLSTITGTLTLYSRTPIELLTFISDVGELDDASAGLPICKLKFGWNIARTDGQVEKLLTPDLSFLITNIAMTDPGKTMGAEFTLSLQDSGSAVLQNSSADIGLAENYPQEQLRIILEKFLGLRLFTLDDLLSLDSNEENKKQLSTTSVSVKYKTKQEVLNYYTTLTGIDIKAAQDNFLKDFVSIEQKIGGTEEDIIQKVFTTNKTFFVNNPTAALRVNSNTFSTVINSLLNRINCRWYPTSNTLLDNEIIASQQAEDNIRELKSRFETEGNTQSLQEEFNKEKEKLASSCVLVWVPYFPKGIYTTSNNFFMEPGDADNPLTQEDGAFLLLPKITTDYSLDALSLPVIYGPGGSSFPYYYSGAQNVFARLSEASGLSTKGITNMVGEVLDVSSNYSGLIALMKLNYEEEMTHRTLGRFISPENNITLTKEQKKKASTEQRAKLEKAAKVLIGNSNPEEVVKQWVTKNKTRFRAIRGRFKQSLAPRNLVNNIGYATSADPTGGIMTSQRVAETTLKHRIGTFLNWPFTIGMTLLGDPYLIRQGIGTFELINYYPTLDGASLKFNPLLSGVYLPQKISHRISLGEYTTEIQAAKVPGTVKDTVIARFQKLNSNSYGSKASAETIGRDSAILDALQNINLETFSGIPSDISTIYKLNDSQKKQFYDKRDINLKILRSKSDAEVLMEAKLRLAPYKGNANTARQDLQNIFDLTLLNQMIDADKTLPDTSQEYKDILKSKLKTVYGSTGLNILGEAQIVFGKTDSVTSNGTVDIASSEMAKLNSLYAQLQQSKYDDMKKALDSISKKG